MACLISISQSSGERINQKKLEDFIRKILKKMGFSLKESDLWISVSFVGKKKIRSVNQKARKKDQVTDVVSIGSLKKGHKKQFESLWGDIYLSYPVVRKQAQIFGHSIDQEIRILIVHALLHLLGYTHQNLKDRVKMRKKERELLGKSLIGR